MNIKTYPIFFVTILSLWSVPTFGLNLSENLKLSGYGTLGLTYDNGSETAFVRELVQPPEVNDRATYDSDTLPFLTDSRAAFQLLYQPNETYELMTQLVFRHQEENGLDEAIEWLYLGINPVENVKLKLGRIGWDAFLMSDHRHLGFAYPWVRPPTEFYAALPVYRLDGIEFKYTNNEIEEGVRWSFIGQYGEGETIFPFGNNQYDFESDIFSVSLNREAYPWRFRVGYSEIDINTAPPLDQLIAGLAQVANLTPPNFANEANSLISNMNYKGSRIRFSALGFSYDDGQWIMQSELGYIESDADMVINGTTAYLSIGKRFKSLTPFVSASYFENLSDVYSAKENWSLIGQSGLQNTAINVLNSTRIEQNTLTLGVRWDFDTKSALKLQFDRTQIDANGYGLWWTSRDKSQDENINVISLTLDYIF